MYLFARLFGISTYLLALLICYEGIIHIQARNSKKIVFIYLLAISIMAYFFVPPDSFDVSRLFIYMHEYAKLSFEQMITLITTNNSTPGTVVYEHIIGQFGRDGLLPGITTFIVFGNCFAIILKTEKNYRVNKTYTALALLWLMACGVYGETIDGIRTMLAFSIVAILVYTEFFEDRSFILHIPLYIVAASIHSASLVLVALRILFLLLQKTDTFFKKIRNIVLLIVVLFVSSVIFQTQIQGAITKASNYLSRDYYSYGWNILTGVLNIVIIVNICRKLRYYCRYNSIAEKKREAIINLTNFVYVILVISIVSLPFDYSIFHRFEYFATMIFTPVPMLYFSLENLYEIDRNRTYNNIFILLVLMLIIVCTRGEVCSLKYWE